MTLDIKMKQELNAYAVLLSPQHEVLMLKRFTNFWEFPGGGVEFGEHPLTTAIRETEEETGVRLDPSMFNRKPLCVSSATYTKYGTRKHAVYIVYVARLSYKPGIRLCSEHIEYEWVACRHIGNKQPLAANVAAIQYEVSNLFKLP